MFAAIKFNW